MKKLIPLFVLFISLIACTSADKSEQANMSEGELRKVFNKDMKEYLQLINNGNYKEAFSYLPDAVFEMASIEELMAVYEQMEASGMRLEMTFMELTDISKVKTKDNDNYCRFNYDGTMIVHLSGQMLTMKGSLLDQFEKQYGGEGREYEDRIEIDITQTVFAVSVDGSKDWKYVEYNNSSKGTIDKVIPSDVINELL